MRCLSHRWSRSECHAMRQTLDAMKYLLQYKTSWECCYALIINGNKLNSRYQLWIHIERRGEEREGERERGREGERERERVRV